jgi:hypothetical protein
MNKIVRVFFESHLGNGHDGLAKLAKTKNVNVRNLNNGEYVIFINKRLNALKMYTSGFTIAHLRLPNGKLDLNTIAMIPSFFNGSEIKYDEAVKKSLLTKLKISQRGPE